MKILSLSTIILITIAKMGIGQFFVNGTGRICKTTCHDAAYKFDHANYTIFIPDSLTQIRGVFIHQHGCGMEGTGAATAYDIQYEAFAKKWGLAIIGPDIYPEQGSGCRDWINPEDGSGHALFAALDSFARMTHHPELKEVPWLLWGHSGGGYWVLKMMTAYPERILAAFCYSAAFNPDLHYSQEVAHIPVMFRHAGNADFKGCWQTASQAFIKLRKMDGYAALAHTRGQTHNFSYVRYMAIPFYESVLLQRLPDSGSTLIKDMDASKSWLGDTMTNEVYQSSTYKGDTQGMSRLPDSTCAAKWKEYVSTGTVIDDTSPPPPYALKMIREDSLITYLTWKVNGDVRSPVQYFNIYKNKKYVGRFPSLDNYQTFDTNGDNALPPIPQQIKFRLNTPIRKQDTFAVSTVNQFNLESVKMTIMAKNTSGITW